MHTFSPVEGRKDVHIPELFQFCPRCGHASVKRRENKAIECRDCGFLLFFNAAAAVGAIIVDARGDILLLRRSRDPGKGLLGLPGGFVDPGESAEDALRREVREECNLELRDMRYLCSLPNRYTFAGVTYATEDLFFVCSVSSLQPLQALDETESCCFVPAAALKEEQVAFPTVWQAICRFAGRSDLGHERCNARGGE